MAIKINGTTVIDNSRNLTNILTATANTVSANTASIATLQDSSGRTLQILDTANNIVWGG